MARDTVWYSAGVGTAMHRVHCKEHKVGRKSSCKRYVHSDSRSQRNMVGNLSHRAPDTYGNTQGFVGIYGYILCASDLDNIHGKFLSRDGHISGWCHI